MKPEKESALFFIFLILVLSISMVSASWWGNFFGKITGKTETCTESWTCTAWGSCSGGSQTRICSDKNNCGTTNNKPIESQSCCIETDTVGDYKTRGTCIDNSGEHVEGCSGSFSAEEWYCTVPTGNCGYISASCPYLYGEGYVCMSGTCVQESQVPKCTENWQCTEWSSGCINRQKTRTCTDLNNCGTVFNRSSLSLGCNETSNCIFECNEAGAKKCSDNTLLVCGDSNNDSCFDWGILTECSAGCSNGNCINQVACTDSDGLNHTIKGTCIDNSGEHVEGCGGSFSVEEWYCAGGSTGNCAYISANCSVLYGERYVCIDGKCVAGVSSAGIVNSQESTISSFGLGGKIVANSSVQLSTMDGKVYATKKDGDKQEIKIDPSTAVNSVKESIKSEEIGEVKINEYKNRIVYEIDVTKPVKIFSLIPAKMVIKSQVDVEEGIILNTEKPWWSFLAGRER